MPIPLATKQEAATHNIYPSDKKVATKKHSEEPATVSPIMAFERVILEGLASQVYSTHFVISAVGVTTPLDEKPT